MRARSGLAVLGGVVAFVGGVAYAGGSNTAADHRPDGGAPTWVTEDGAVEPEKIPELIPVTGPDGDRVGFIRREVLYPELFGEPMTPEQLVDSSGPEEVIDSGGELVGHVYPGAGYIPLGEKPGPDRSVSEEHSEDRGSE